jgi:ATP-dependent RNA helicase DDX51/DBP6
MRDAHPLDGKGDVEFDAAGISLDARLIAALRAGGVERLFPVQAAVWRTLHGGAHDLCVHAPTGSGKTLAYALPVVAALSGRVIRRLRALVVLPTHDLVQQARATQLAGVLLTTADLPRR